MRIIRLQAEGFKRLVAVDISPEGDLIEIRGNNGEGKSSVLDAIFAALGGKEAAPVKPVRTGEEYAIIRLDLGNIKVTRYFGEDGTTSIKVTNDEGAVYQQPQSMLDALVGSISFDPFEFAGMDGKEQAAEIRRLVKLDVDLDDLAAKDKADYDARREVNRDAAALKARIEGIVVPADLPEEVPDKAKLVDALSNAAETNSAIERERVSRETRVRNVEEGKARCERIDSDIQELEARIATLREEGAQIIAEGAKEMDAIEALPPLGKPVDTSELRAQIAEAEELGTLILVRDQKAKMAIEFQTLKTRSESLTKAMVDRAAVREKALAAADMPVAGLGFATIDDDLVVTFNGEPFSQASDAERVRVSTAIAMAANPKLRVLRVKQGSLLDATSIKLLAETAKTNDFQIWGEFVGEEGAGIIMEAGKVKGAGEPERVEPPKRRKKGVDEPDEKLVATTKGGPTPVAGEGGLVGDPPAKRKPQALDEMTSTPAAGKLL